jgi:hypothetical protein
MKKCGRAIWVGLVWSGLWQAAWSADQARAVTVLEAPGVGSRPSIEGKPVVLVNGRLLTPAGKFVKTQSYSWGRAVSPD